ncbi:ABC transporter ATP-binding protein [Agromyces sp. Leaf222]|uniref:ABC transporter ATP-binding protein n=1 Tax=Agromyces sp. Leaf222 TaxID=1735688 RepID=UPI0006F36E6E|nr:ABC transporter ATP-binding protein [Agromyces sp. Leaf222]KQM82948.1 multidrug ABC transporter ATP-binding protein [Agromyces sp. Leaf222]
MSTPDRLDGARPVIAVDGLQMRYGAHEVLRDVSFEVGRGEVLALLGPNGAGKTSTIEILEGLRRRSAGRVEVLGIDPAQADERWRARVGVVLQSWRDHAKWCVRELLEYQGSLAAPYSTDSIIRPWPVGELLAAVGLAEQSDRMLKSLSGGQRRRLDVAIGLVGRPELVFFDEPTAGLDPQARRDFHDLVRRIAQELDTTILMTTHDLSEAEQLADRIAILTDGRIVADGTSDDLARRIVGEDEVRWTFEGQSMTHHVRDSTAFARQLFEQHGRGIADLEIRRASLEDTYLALVQAAEAAAESRGVSGAASGGTDGPRDLAEANR